MAVNTLARSDGQHLGRDIRGIDRLYATPLQGRTAQAGARTNIQHRAKTAHQNIVARDFFVQHIGRCIGKIRIITLRPIAVEPYGIFGRPERIGAVQIGIIAHSAIRPGQSKFGKGLVPPRGKVHL